MRRTLLIVDDIRVNREILKNILGDEYAVIEAGNGIEATEIMNRRYNDISAVLLDLSMPEMNGFEVIGYMRKNANLKQLPIIVTTGQTDNASEVKALELGANDYISKPYNPTIIKQRIKNVIDMRENSAMVNEFQRDRLTGIYNRNTFFEKASVLISEKNPGYYVLASFDINGFKVINDRYGTDKGDFVLRFIANAFREEFSGVGGLYARIMADNFAMLYPQYLINTGTLDNMLQKITELDGSITPISYSVGRYIVDDLSLSVSAMYDRAALARASIKGRYDVHIAMFDESMRDKLLQEQQIISEMKTALKTGQFETWFQPQYNHATGELIGAEALVRWHHPKRGILSPALFIPVFEKNGFIYELDKFIWEQVCRSLRRWTDEGRSPLPISVNISRYDMLSDDLVEVLSSLIDKYKLPVRLLRLEVTESAFMKSTASVINVVKALIRLGFTVEIDDFGSGYSSLNTLKDVPAQILKLDMKFLEATDDSNRGGNILESIIRMAKWLEMTVIAEGVETMEQADFLKSVAAFTFSAIFIQSPYLHRNMKPLPQKVVNTKILSGLKLLRIWTITPSGIRNQ